MAACPAPRLRSSCSPGFSVSAIGLAWLLLVGAAEPVRALDPFPGLARSFDTLPLDPEASGVATGDLNGDGYTDCVVASQALSSVRVYFGTADQPVPAPTTIATGLSPNAVLLGDFNADNTLDLITTHFDASTLGVRLGIGDGTFGARTDYPELVPAAALAAGDVTADGVPDLVTIGNKWISVFPGTGSGGFGPRIDIDALLPLVSLFVAELTGDTKADIGVSRGTTYIYPSLGGGAFGARLTVPGVGTGLVIAAAEMNQDGRSDLVWTGGSSDWGYLPALSGGGFGAPVGFTHAAGVFLEPTLLDYDEDGLTDAILSSYGQNFFQVWHGDGGGTFSLRDLCETGDGPWRVAAGKFAGSPAVDLVVINSDCAALGIHEGQGNGNFRGAVRLDLPNRVSDFAWADFVEDGRLDLVVPDATAGVVRVYQAVSPTAFIPGNTYPIDLNAVQTHPALVAAGDLTGDGHQDFAVCSQEAGGNAAHLRIFHGAGTGAFVLAQTIDLPTSPSSLRILDVDSDGRQDLTLTQGGTLRIYYGAGNVLLTQYQSLSVATGDVDWGDVDGNFLADVVIGYSDGFEVTLNLGTRNFAPSIFRRVGPLTTRLAVTDMNYDGRADVLALHPAESRISVLFASGGGAFGTTTTLATRCSPVSVLGGEFNGDGRPDVVVAAAGSNELSIYPGAGGFLFGDRYDIGSGAAPGRARVVDLDLDERDDIVVLQTGSPSLALHRNGATYVAGMGETPAAPTARPGLRAWPSPSEGVVSFGAELPSPGRARLEIFDLQGRRVAVPFVGELAAGPVALTWAGRDAHNRAVPAGLYLARLSWPGGEILGKLVRK